MNLREIVTKFDIHGGNIKDIIPWGNGHINDTYRVIIDDTSSNSNDYILQRVNHEVFPNVKDVMENQIMVIDHVVANHFMNKGLFQPPIQRNNNDNNSENNKKSATQSYLYHNEEGWWRITEFALDYKSYDQADIDVAIKAGSTIGNMVVALSTFNPNKLHITIADFHNIHKRMDQLNQAWSNASSKRRQDAQNAMDRIQVNAHIFLEMYDTALSGELPLRVTHNDTKLNNLLFHKDIDIGKVIDLDTLMPGYIFFDIGDVLRSGMIDAAEDEVDLTKVTLNKEACDAFIKSFTSTAQSVLTQKEMTYIPMSGAYMSYMLSTRFLADYLNGDTYFKTHYDGHNLVRCLCQQRVCDVFREHYNLY